MADNPPPLPPGYAAALDASSAPLPPGYSAAGSAEEDKPSRLERIGRELASPFIEAGRLVSHIPSPVAWMLPDLRGKQPIPDLSGKMDEVSRQNEARIAAARGPDAGFNWERLGVDVVNPVNYVGWGVGRAAGLVRSLPAVAGAAAALLQPANSSDFWTEKAGQAGLGAALGQFLPPAIKGAVGGFASGSRKFVSEPILSWLGQTKGPEAIRSAAVQSIMDKIDKSAASGGPTAQMMLDLINAHPDKPLSLVDVGGKGVERLAGKVSRAPGQGQEIIPRFLEGRNLDAQGRLLGDVSKNLSSGPAYETADALMQARPAAAKPLFEKAYDGGSIAPLEQQFRTAWVDAGKAAADAQKAVSAAERRITQATAAQARAGNDVNLLSGANAELKAAHAELEAADRASQEAEATKSQTFDMMRQAQDDIASNKPGAVWNPRIQQFLQNPRIQQGIKRGLVIERDNALAEGRPINPSEYAIVGTDANGEPLIGKVPTMRLLAVAKEGLDRILQSPELRNEFGQLNKEGVAVDKVRRAFLDELDSLNPDYKVARAQWSGDTDSMNALRLGQDFIKQRPEAIRDAVAKMSPNDREFYKMGVADWARKAIQTAGPSNPAQRIIQSADWEAIGVDPSQRMNYIRQQLRPAFDSDADFKKFMDSMLAERQMFAARGRITGGSQTAERVGEDVTPGQEAAGHAARSVYHAVRGGGLEAAMAAQRVGQALGIGGDQQVNAEISRILGAPASQMPEEMLNRMVAPLPAAPAPQTGNLRALMAPGTVSAAEQLGMFP